MNKTKYFLIGVLLSVSVGIAAATFSTFGPVTGILFGSATSPQTRATVSTDITPLFSCGGSATLFLNGAGGCTGGATGANPTGTAGLTAVNGTATTFMRSDAAPPISQAITPTWTNLHTFNGDIEVNATQNSEGIQINGNSTTGQSDGIQINAGTNATDFAISVFNQALTKGLFQLRGDGSFALGFATSSGTANILTENSNVVSLNSAGSVTAMQIASNGSTTFDEPVTISPPSGTSLNVVGSTNAFSAIVKSGSGGAGSEQGMQIQGGSAAADDVFSVANLANTVEFVSVNGVGAVFLRSIATSSAATSGTVCWTSGTGNLTVDTTTTCLLSARKFKQQIASLDSGLSEVMKLRPVSYELKPEFNPSHLGTQVGFIADEVQTVDPRLVSLDPIDGSVRAMRYQQLTAVLVKAIQDQQKEIDFLKKHIH